MKTARQYAEQGKYEEAVEIYDELLKAGEEYDTLKSELGIACKNK